MVGHLRAVPGPACSLEPSPEGGAWHPGRRASCLGSGVPGSDLQDAAEVSRPRSAPPELARRGTGQCCLGAPRWNPPPLGLLCSSPAKAARTKVTKGSHTEWCEVMHDAVRKTCDVNYFSLLFMLFLLFSWIKQRNWCCSTHPVQQGCWRCSRSCQVLNKEVRPVAELLLNGCRQILDTALSTVFMNALYQLKYMITLYTSLTV